MDYFRTPPISGTDYNSNKPIEGACFSCPLLYGGQFYGINSVNNTEGTNLEMRVLKYVWTRIESEKREHDIRSSHQSW